MPLRSEVSAHNFPPMQLHVGSIGYGLSISIDKPVPPGCSRWRAGKRSVNEYPGMRNAPCQRMTLTVERARGRSTTHTDATRTHKGVQSFVWNSSSSVNHVRRDCSVFVASSEEVGSQQLTDAMDPGRLRTIGDKIGGGADTNAWMRDASTYH
jgi:hypothetical protein